jgi:hypothetical protein
MLSVCSDGTDGILCVDYAGTGLVIYPCTAADLVAFINNAQGFKIPYSSQIQYVTFVNVTSVVVGCPALVTYVMLFTQGYPV